MAIYKLTTTFLNSLFSKTKTVAAKLNETIDIVNDLNDGAITTTNLTLSGTLIQSLTTDSTSSTTGAITTAGGLGVAKAIFGGSTINAVSGFNAGLGGAAGYGFTGDSDTYIFRNTANTIGFTAGGITSLNITASQVQMDVIAPNALTYITFNGTIVRKNFATAINTSATVTATQLAGGLLTSTSAAPVTMTLPTASSLATFLGASQGTIFDFVVDNSAGANTVTVAVNTGIVASGFPGTNTLTLASSATIGIATFRITFISATAATLARIS